MVCLRSQLQRRQVLSMAIDDQIVCSVTHQFKDGFMFIALSTQMRKSAASIRNLIFHTSHHSLV